MQTFVGAEVPENFYVKAVGKPASEDVKEVTNKVKEQSRLDG